MSAELVVLYQWKESVSEERILSNLEAIRSMKGNVPGLIEVKIGADCYASGQWSHGACLSFESAAALREYSQHPEHDRIVSLIVPDLETLQYCGFEC